MVTMDIKPALNHDDDVNMLVDMDCIYKCEHRGGY